MKTDRTDNSYLEDILELRHSAQGLLQSADAGAAENSVALLQTVMSAEIICVFRYTGISMSAMGLRDARIGAEFLEQANDERRHMQAVARRIAELGGRPDFTPQMASSGNSPDDGDLAGRLRLNLMLEQHVIAHYRELIGHFAGHDAVTCEMLEAILEEEENHTADMQDLLLAQAVDPGSYRH